MALVRTESAHTRSDGRPRTREQCGCAGHLRAPLAVRMGVRIGARMSAPAVGHGPEDRPPEVRDARELFLRHWAVDLCVRVPGLAASTDTGGRSSSSPWAADPARGMTSYYNSSVLYRAYTRGSIPGEA